MADQLVPYREGMEYGIGLDTPSADARNTAVAGDPTSIPNAAGSIVQFELSEVSSDEDLQTALGISASVTGGCGPFSASASMDFAKSCHVHENSVFLLASVTVMLGFSQVKAPKILPEAAAKLADGNSTRFQEMYGDSFVRGMQTGGRFFSVIEIFTADSTEHDSLSVKVKASYGPFGGEGSFSSDFRQAMSNRSVKITTHSEGGVIPRSPTSLDEIQATASGFAATVEGHAVPYAVLLDKYTILDLPNPPNFADLEHQRDVLTFCARERNKAWTAINNVEFIIDNPGQFSDAPGQPDRTPLTAYRQALDTDLDSIAKAASHALDHPKDAAMPTLTAIAPPFPARRAGEADTLASQGDALAKADPLAQALRATLPAGPAWDGFNTAMAVEVSNTAWDPGQQSIKDSLGGAQQVGFQLGVDYCQSRNANRDVTSKGAAVLAADPGATAARDRLPAGLQWLGFQIATGLFGNPKLGAAGNTLMGPGSQKIRDSLAPDARTGFDAGVTYHLAQKYV
jgi:hypothetical protein